MAHSPAEIAAARKRDKATHTHLRKLAKRHGNARCADCGSNYPGWASLPHGVFLCIDCAQLHRRVGRHVSQVKAINTGTYLWHEDELNVMRTNGNALVNAMLLAHHPEGARATAQDLAFVQDKYERRRWAMSEQELQSASATAAAEEEEQRLQQRREEEQQTAAATVGAGVDAGDDWFEFVMGGDTQEPPNTISTSEGPLFSVSSFPSPSPHPESVGLVSVKQPELDEHEQQPPQSAETFDARLTGDLREDRHQKKVENVMAAFGPTRNAHRPFGDAFFSQFGV